MNLNKKELEELISRKKTLGNYIFDEEKQCFFGDTETELCIKEVTENKYKSICYFFDGYEIGLNEDEVEFYEGTEDEAKQMAIKSFNEGDKFMGYPVIYTNVTCELYEGEDYD